MFIYSNMYFHRSDTTFLHKVNQSELGLFCIYLSTNVEGICFIITSSNVESYKESYFISFFQILYGLHPVT